MMLSKLKNAFGAKDMTTGRPLAAIMRFSLPLLLGNVAQLMYGMVNARSRFGFVYALLSVRSMEEIFADR